MVEQQRSLDEFMKNYEEQSSMDKEVTTSRIRRGEPHSRLSVTKFTLAISLRVTSLELKASLAKTPPCVSLLQMVKSKLWVNGYEEQHFLQFIERLEKKGIDLPVKVDFLRSQEESKQGNKYNRLRIMETASGEEVQFELDSF